MRVLVTRPEPMGQELVRLLQQRGIEAVHFPALIINPVKKPQPLTELFYAEFVIFISPNAVKYGAKYLNLSNKQQLIAVGMGSASALQELGFTNVVVPDELTSEGLLETSILQQINGKKIAVVKGLGGREFLRDSLVARGALVTEFAVYQRLRPNKLLDQAKLAEIDVILATSIESVENLIAMTPESLRAELWNRHWLVTSARIERFVHLQASQVRTVLADNASNETLLRSLESFAKSP